MNQQQSQSLSAGPGKNVQRLHIRHRTRYGYQFPVRLESHRLVLRPREGHDLQVVEHELSVSPTARCVWSRDIFGNSITWAHFSDESVNELVIESRLVVDRVVPAESGETSTLQSELLDLVYDALEQPTVSAYLTLVYPEEADALQTWCASLPRLGDFGNFQDYLLALAREINTRISYRRREEKGVQTPLNTVNLGSGSCRDMATLMMETLRLQGIAARFASGYLDCEATRAARGSTHAWTEAYLPELGWVGYDPTTGKPCGVKHVVIGTSHHPRGVMPISGKFYGATNAFAGLSVTVEFS